MQPLEHLACLTGFEPSVPDLTDRRCCVYLFSDYLHCLVLKQIVSLNEIGLFFHPSCPLNSTEFPPKKKGACETAACGLVLQGCRCFNSAFKLRSAHVVCFQYIPTHPSVFLLCIAIRMIFSVSLSAGAPHAGCLSRTCVCV